MLVFDCSKMGNRLLSIRKKRGLTQAEVAEKAGLSDRTYADIERGTVNMRTETLLRICNTLQITPNEIFVDEKTVNFDIQDIMNKLNNCTEFQKKTALEILNAYLNSL